MDGRIHLTHSYDQVGPTGTGELLARWAIQTEVAVERNPSSWDYAGLDIVAGTALRSKFTEWLTGRLKERAQSWQQERLHRNECKQQKGKGKGNIDNDSDDDGEFTNKRRRIIRRRRAKPVHGRHGRSFSLAGSWQAVGG